MADTAKTSKAEWEISQLVRTRLFPDSGDERHSETVLHSALHVVSGQAGDAETDGDPCPHTW